jgi:hypothetical protein
VEPASVVDPELKLVPPRLQFIGKLNHVTEVIRMRAVDEA